MGDSKKSDKGGRKKAAEVVAKSEAHQVPAKAEEKAAGNKSLIIAKRCINRPAAYTQWRHIVPAERARRRSFFD